LVNSPVPDSIKNFMNIRLRRITLRDAAVLATMAQATFYDTFHGTCTEADMQSFLNTYFNLDQTRKELSDPDDLFYFAEVDGVPAGYIRMMEDYRSFEMMEKWKALELKRIYVSKEFQGRKVAQALMDFVLTYAAEHHYEVVWLGVWELNHRALKFYGKYGFEDSGYTHPFPIGQTPQTDKWLWKFLDRGKSV